MIRNYIQNVYEANFFHVMYIDIYIEGFENLKSIVKKNISKKQRKVARDNRSKSLYGSALYEKQKEKNRENMKLQRQPLRKKTKSASSPQ